MDESAFYRGATSVVDLILIAAVQFAQVQLQPRFDMHSKGAICTSINSCKMHIAPL